MDLTIYTKDRNYAYSVRSKCSDLGYDINYIDDQPSLFLYIMSNLGSVILLDCECESIVANAIPYCNSIKTCRHTFVFLNDRHKMNITANNINSFECSYKDLESILNQIKDINLKKTILPTAIWSKNEISIRISQELDKFRISRKLRGHQYIRDCLFIAFDNEECLKRINKNLYSLVGDLCNASSRCVEKDIRMAIKKAAHEYPECFEIEAFHGRVTNLKFLTHILENLKADFYNSLD